MQGSLVELRADTSVLLSKHPAPYTDEQVDAFTAQRAGAAELVATASKIPSMIFVCVHNAGRSQMSAGFARHLAGDRAVVFSGGSNPGPAVNPMAVQAMAEVGIDISGSFPVPFTDEIVEACDVVVTMGCGDVCPFFPGKRYVDWDLADPHEQALPAVREVRDEIERRVSELLAELGVIQ